MVLVYVSVLVNEGVKFISADARKRTCSTVLGNTYVQNAISVLLDCEITAHSWHHKKVHHGEGLYAIASYK